MILKYSRLGYFIGEGFSNVFKNIPNIIIVAHIIISDAPVDFLFLNTLLNPSPIK